MPRGVRGSRDFEAELAMIDGKIEGYKAKLETWENNRKELLAKKQEQDMSEVYKFMRDSGMTSEEVLQRLKSV
jgi:flagellar motility protein MotE (MotC chaperone)